MSSSCKYKYKDGKWYIDEGLDKGLVHLETVEEGTDSGPMHLVQYVDDTQDPDLGFEGSQSLDLGDDSEFRPRVRDLGLASYKTCPVVQAHISGSGQEAAYHRFERSLERPYVRKDLKGKAVDYSKVPQSLVASLVCCFFQNHVSTPVGKWKTC